MAAEVARYNTGPEDGFVHSLDRSPYLPQPHTAITDRSRDLSDVPLTSGSVAPGSTAVFNVPKEGDQLDDLFAEVTIGPLTVAGSTYRRFVDAIGYFMFQEIEYTYANNKIDTVYPEWSYYRHQSMLNNETRAGWDNLTASNKSAAERNALAAGTQVIETPLTTTWQFIRCHALFIAGLSNLFTIKLKFRPLNQMVQHDAGGGVAPAATFSGKLKATYVHLRERERNYHQALTVSPTGVSQKVYSVQTQPIQYIESGSTTAELELNQFSGATYDLFINGRQEVPDASDGTADYTTQWPGGAPTTMEIVDGKTQIVPVHRVSMLNNYNHSKYHAAGVGGLLGYSFAENPDAGNSCSGSVNFGTMTNPRLKLTFATATTARQSVVINAVTHQLLQHQGGRLHTVLGS